MDWEIESFKRLGSVRFGMTAAEIAAILGNPVKQRKSGANTSRNIYAADLPIVTFNDGFVEEIAAKHGSKYDAAIGQMLLYAACLKKHKMIN
jgi:hypothetical protein